MDDVRFDALTRAISRRSDRRSALRALLGLGGAVALGSTITDSAEAARRGYPGPTWPVGKNAQFCPAGSDTCGGGAGCNSGTGYCMTGHDTPNISYCAIGMSLSYGSCGSCQTHDDCYLLTGDSHSPCVTRDANCQSCQGTGGACAVLQP